MRGVTKATIVRGLRKLGLKEGDVVTVHSALSSFGKVEGGPRTVVDALLEAIGKTGTLLMPTASSDKPYNFRKSPSSMGAISEEFRKRRGTVRSMCPIMPTSALGPLARGLVENHHRSKSPYINSPYDLAAKAGAYVLLLGVDQDRSTTLHCAEALAPAPYTREVQGQYVDEKGKVRTYKATLGAGPHRNFIGLDPKLRRAGILKITRIGNCVARLMKAQEMIDFVAAAIRRDPTTCLTHNDGYYAGVWQRGVCRATRTADEETFTLVVRTSSAGANMEEVLWHAEGAGATGLEVDVMDGRDISLLNADDLAHLTRRAAERGLELSVVRSNIQSEKAFRASLKAAKQLGAEAVIAPLVGSVETLKARARNAKRHGLKMLFENVAISWRAVDKLMRALGPAAGLAFNPANFAAAGDLPFLDAARPLKRFVRYLAITDASPLGVPCVPGSGYGEVKEVMSHLRCSSFDGFISLCCAPSAELPFADIADAFYKLLDES